MIEDGCKMLEGDRENHMLELGQNWNRYVTRQSATSRQLGNTQCGVAASSYSCAYPPDSTADRRASRFRANAGVRSPAPPATARIWPCPDLCPRRSSPD